MVVRLVKKLQETAILIQAATNVMAVRAREVQGGGDIERLSKQLEELWAENNWLRGGVEHMMARLPPPITSSPALPSRRTRPTKKRRIVELSDSGEEGVARPLPSDNPPLDDENFLPLMQRRGRREKKKGEVASLSKEDGAFFTSGLTLGGKARRIEAYPPGLPDKRRAEHDALLEALTPFLEGMSLQEDKSGPAYRRLWEQANAVKSKLCSLRGEVYIPPPMPTTLASYGFGPGRLGTVIPAQSSVDQYVSPSIIDKEAEASRSQRGSIQMQRESGRPLPSIHASPAVPADEEAPKKGKKKKKGKKGKAPPPPAGPQVAKGEAGKPQPTQLPKSQQEPGPGKKNPPSQEKKQITSVTAPQLSAMENGQWTEVVKKGAHKRANDAGAVRTPAPAKSRSAGGPPAPSQQQQRAQSPVSPPKSKGKKKGESVVCRARRQ